MLACALAGIRGHLASESLPLILHSCRLIGTKCRARVALYCPLRACPLFILCILIVLLCPPDYFDVVDQKSYTSRKHFLQT
jgi:hypothetical protein